MQLKPAFPGQPVVALKVRADPIKFTTTVTTGQIAVSTNLVYTLINNFTTRFATWDEYRVTKVLFRFNCFSSTNPGLIRAWIEDRSSSAPTNAIAEAEKGISFAAGDITRTHTLVYRIMDPVYVDYTALNATQSVGYLNVFTNNANWGSSTVATDYFTCVPEFTIQFRGFA
jgi:hypothetical protein